MNETHDPLLESWVEAANEPGCDFPIRNLPFGVFRRGDSAEQARCGVAIGDSILDVAACAEDGLLDSGAGVAAEACRQGSLNALMALGAEHWSALRLALSRLLRRGRARHRHLTPMSRAEMFLPARIGDYTDFYSSLFHAENVGRLFRPGAPLPPNYKYVPIAYHGRASSVVVSGTAVRRPWGQTKAEDDAEPRFGPSLALDYEAELGFFIGPGNALGEPVPIAAAWDRIFGFCLLNDWSARDIQAWEYQPLGPFLGKNFATAISPWIVTAEALEPFRVASYRRGDGDPAPLPYLNSEEDRQRGGVSIVVEASIRSREMSIRKMPPLRLSRSNFADAYWTVAQMAAHHASNGCNLRPGDLLGTGTISGAGKDARGSLLELTMRGAEPLALPTGESRRFLEDGDEVRLTARCESPGRAPIGFGECRGIILPSPPA